jgi:HPt (histidine-containing phosphotransfer) domain-containing protein
MAYKYIQLEYLDSVSEGDAGIVRDIVDIFKNQVVEIYDEMNQYLADKNYKALGLLAHKAKSSVSIMGINELAVILKTFELQAVNGIESENYESYIKRFKSDTDAAILELEQLIENMAQGKNDKD